MGRDYHVVITPENDVRTPTKSQVIDIVKAILDANLIEFQHPEVGPLKNYVVIGDAIHEPDQAIITPLIGKKEVDERLIKEVEKWDESKPLSIIFASVSARLKDILLNKKGIDLVVVGGLTIEVKEREYHIVGTENECFKTQFAIEINMCTGPWDDKVYLKELSEDKVLSELIKKIELITGQKMKMRSADSY
jgi:hypothetical protein